MVGSHIEYIPLLLYIFTQVDSIWFKNPQKNSIKANFKAYCNFERQNLLHNNLTASFDVDGQLVIAGH